MKTFKLTMLSMIALTVLTLISCSENASSPLTSDESTTADAVYCAVQSPTDAAEACEYQDGTTDAAMEMKPPQHEGRKYDPLRRVMSKLNLTDTQKVQIATFTQEYKDCITLAKQALRESEKAILEAAKLQRDSIITEYKNGTITKEEARTQIKELNAATRELLKNNPLKETTEAAILLCWETYIANIRGILTTEQQVIWDEWIAAHPFKK